MDLTTIRSLKYGWIPDLPDQRDYRYDRLTLFIPSLPKKVDLRKSCSPVENQGTIGSCTAQALVGNLEFLKFKSLKKFINFSRLFLYYNERIITRTVKQDSGASIRDGIKTLVKLGDCLEDLWPYNLIKFVIKPSIKAYQNAKKYQITSYYRLNSLEQMRHTISLGWPFVFGFAVYESFETEKVSKTGVISMPKKDERLLGGHAVMVAGYDDEKQWFIIRNSWGKDWGDHGYCYMPYKYILNLGLASDFWTIRGME